jgi:DHA2 family multidrug resistance protein-like MFS transporter
MRTDDVASVPRRAGRREWTGLAVIALPCLLYAMDLTVLNLAVPSLSADLKPSSTQLLWITDIYGFLLAGSLITMGTLGDRIGRRRLLLIGSAAFGLASVLAALSTSAEMLIATRALLGVAGATLAPSTLALISNMFSDPKQRTFAVAVWVTSFSAGAALGPVLGGVLLERFWWGSVFLLAVPVMALLLLIGPLLLPEFRDPRPGRLDLRSAVLSLAAVLTVIYGLKQLAQDGPGWPPVLLVLAGVALGAVFVRRQQALPDPLLDLRLFRVPAFSAALAVNVLGFFVLFGMDLFLVQYLQLVVGLSPFLAGLWAVPSAAALIAGSMVTPAITRRAHPAVVMAVGFGLAAIGFGLLSQVDPDGASGLAVLVAGSVIFSFGVAPGITLVTDLIVGAAPPERAGAASAISETGSELGGALGIAILGSIGTAVYRTNVVDGLPASMSPEAATAARDTLGGAVAVAGQLAGRPGAALLGAAREAFTQGLQVTAALSAAIVVAIAVLAFTLLRRTGDASGEATRPARSGYREAIDRLVVALVAQWPALTVAILRPRPVRGSRRSGTHHGWRRAGSSRARRRARPSGYPRTTTAARPAPRVTARHERAAAGRAAG